MKRLSIARGVWPVAISILMLTGCVFRDVRTQQEKMETYCRISGTVTATQSPAAPLLVGLVRHNGGISDDPQNWSLVDHFVLESPGRWMFRAGPGTYGLVAFV